MNYSNNLILRQKMLFFSKKIKVIKLFYYFKIFIKKGKNLKEIDMHGLHCDEAIL